MMKFACVYNLRMGLTMKAVADDGLKLKMQKFNKPGCVNASKYPPQLKV